MRTTLSSVTLLCASLYLHCIALGLLQSFGIIYSELLDYFDSGIGETSWIASLNTCLFLSSGLIGGILVKHYGFRKVAIIGSIIAAVGEGTSMFVPSMYYLYLTYGVVVGFGLGLINLASDVSVTIGFNKHRALALAIASMGGGIGTFALPFLTTYCLKEYDWRGCFIILSGVILEGVVAGALLRTDAKKTHEGICMKKTCEENVTETKTWTILKQILANKTFILLLVSGILVNLAYFTPFVMFPDYAKTKGLSNEEASMVITVSGISSICGRIIIGLIADTKYANKFVLHGGALVLVGLGTIGVLLIEPKYYLYLVYGSILGLCTGVFAFFQAILIADIVGVDDVSIALGIMYFMEGISSLIGTPVSGWISDSTGHYEGAFLYAGSLFIAGGLIALSIPIIMRFHSQGRYRIRKGKNTLD